MFLQDVASEGEISKAKLIYSFLSSWRDASTDTGFAAASATA